MDCVNAGIDTVDAIQNLYILHLLNSNEILMVYIHLCGHI